MGRSKELHLPLFYGYVKKLEINGTPILTMCSTQSDSPPNQPRLMKSRHFTAFLERRSTGTVVFTSSSLLQSKEMVFPRFEEFSGPGRSTTQ